MVDIEEAKASLSAELSSTSTSNDKKIVAASHKVIDLKACSPLSLDRWSSINDKMVGRTLQQQHETVVSARVHQHKSDTGVRRKEAPQLLRACNSWGSSTILSRPVDTKNSFISELGNFCGPSVSMASSSALNNNV
jgi:hypothetical protein